MFVHVLTRPACDSVQLTHCSKYQIGILLQVIFSSEFSDIKIVVFWHAFHWNLPRSESKHSSIGLENGFISNRRQAIIWTNDGIVNCHIMCLTQLQWVKSWFQMTRKNMMMYKTHRWQTLFKFCCHVYYEKFCTICDITMSFGDICSTFYNATSQYQCGSGELTHTAYWARKMTTTCHVSQSVWH